MSENFQESEAEADKSQKLFGTTLRKTTKKQSEPTMAYSTEMEDAKTKLEKKVKELEEIIVKKNKENEKFHSEIEKFKREKDKLNVQHEKTIIDLKKHTPDDTLKKELDRLKEENNKLRIENKSLISEKDTLRTSLSKIAGNSLTDSNPFIADLSNPHRPEKLAEKCNSLYDNEWTDAYENLEKSSENDEKKICCQLIDIFKECWSFCQETADQQLLQLCYSFLQIDHAGQQQSKDKPCNFLAEQPSHAENNNDEASDVNDKTANTLLDRFPIQNRRIIKDTRRLLAKNVIEGLCKKFSEKIGDTLKDRDGTKNFTEACVELCWYSVISDPPIHFAFDLDIVDDFRAFTQSGEDVDFVVWPAMYLYHNGPLLYKGVVQYRAKQVNETK